MKRAAFTALIIAAAVLPLVALGMMNRFDKKPMTLEEELAELPNKLNPTLPQTINQATELIEVATTGKSITYKYRIVTASAAEIDTLQLMNALSAEIKGKACGDAELSGRFLRNGVTLHYVYHDRNMQQFGFVDVAPGDCGY